MIISRHMYNPAAKTGVVDTGTAYEITYTPTLRPNELRQAGLIASGVVWVVSVYVVCVVWVLCVCVAWVVSVCAVWCCLGTGRPFLSVLSACMWPFQRFHSRFAPPPSPAICFYLRLPLPGSTLRFRQ